MKPNRLGATAGLIAALLAASPAMAQTSFVAIDGNKLPIDMAAVFSGGNYHPRHVLEGLFGGAPTALSVDASGNLNVNIISGGTAAVTNAGTFAVQNTAAMPPGANTIGGVTIADAASATLGAKGDPAWDGSASTPTEMAVLKYAGLKMEAIRALLAANAPAPVTQSGTWTDDASGTTGTAVPAKAKYVGAISSGNLVGIIQADNTVAINISTPTTTQLVALSAGKKIYVTALDVMAGGAGNITFEYGTGTACATGTTVLTGAYPLTAQNGVAKGAGLGPVLVVPASNALCALTSAAVQMSGSVAYTQF